MEFVQIQWTAGSIDEARRIMRYLVQEREVAFAEIIPWVESVSMLNNQLETIQESKVYMVTAKDKLQRVKDVIAKGSSFQIAEVIVLPVLEINEDFLHWIQESLRIPVGN